MRRLILCLLLIISSIPLISQTTRVAILDFENIFGIPKYDGLGKAMSSMLISDIESNVSSKRLQLVERSQINKILKEQNFQASSAVDKTSAVKAGKILGVKYLLVGDIYIQNDILVINARLADTETGDIKFSKKQEGNLSQWLTLKTNIAKDLTSSISMPFSEPNIPDKEINSAVITSYGNALSAKDNGNLEKAQELIVTIQDFSPDFKYIDDLKNEINEIKNEISEIKKKSDESVIDPYGTALDLYNRGNYDLSLHYFYLAEKRINSLDRYKFNKKAFIFYYSSLSYYNLKDYQKAYDNVDSCLKIYPYFKLARVQKLAVLKKMEKWAELNSGYSAFLFDYNKFQVKTSYELDYTVAESNYPISLIVDGFGKSKDSYFVLDSVINIGRNYAAYYESIGRSKEAIELLEIITSNLIENPRKLEIFNPCLMPIEGYVCFEELGLDYLKYDNNKRKAINLIKTIYFNLMKTNFSDCTNRRPNKNYFLTNYSIILGHLFYFINKKDSAAFYYCNAINIANSNNYNLLLKYDNGEVQYKLKIEEIAGIIQETEINLKKKIIEDSKQYNLQNFSEFFCSNEIEPGLENDKINPMLQSFKNGVDAKYVNKSVNIIFKKDRSFILLIGEHEISGKYERCKTQRSQGDSYIITNCINLILGDEIQNLIPKDVLEQCSILFSELFIDNHSREISFQFYSPEIMVPVSKNGIGCRPNLRYCINENFQLRIKR
jgi:TolB-like protein